MARDRRGFDAALRGLEDRGQRRALRHVAGPLGREVVLDGRRVLNFSSNDYLGLANHSALRTASVRAVERHGTGTGASRLIVGSHDFHAALERELAHFHGAEAAILFNSGYHANVGLLAALAGAGDAIFSDELNHASIIDGCRLSRASVVVWPHRDMATLGRALSARSAAAPAGRLLVVTDAVFSMDGDRAPLAALRALCDRHGAMLLVDEAHAVGVLGPNGRGATAEAGATSELLVGTLGKAFGSFGAYAVGRRDVVEWLVNRARSFVFTTALPAGVVEASRAALRLIASGEGDERRTRLAQRVRRLRAGLAELGLVGPERDPTAIVPIVLGAEARAMECSRQLFERGFHVQGIRPPTVPRGTSRLRIALTAAHTLDDIERLIGAMASLTASGLIPRRNHDD